MSSFTLPLIVTPMPDGRNWKLHHSFSYHIGSKYSRHIVKVPKGFITDFASTDLLQWAGLISLLIYICLSKVLPNWIGYVLLVLILLALLITPYGKQGKPAVIHDYLYHTHQLNRAMADLVFFEAMRIVGTPKWKAWLMYKGVHWFGWLIWYRR